MDQEARRLRTEAQRLAQGEPPGQVRYPDAFREAAVAVARRRLGRGGTVARLAREIGVSEPTLTKWLHPPAPPGLRPVAVATPPAPERSAAAGLVLTTPTGVRVTGLDPRHPGRRAAGAGMIGSTRQLTVWAYGAPADLRKAFDGLSALVSQGLGQDPCPGIAIFSSTLPASGPRCSSGMAPGCASTPSGWSAVASPVCGATPRPRSCGSR
jgi:transposase-like protein